MNMKKMKMRTILFKLKHYHWSFARFLAIASSTALSCFKSSSLLDEVEPPVVEETTADVPVDLDGSFGSELAIVDISGKKLSFVDSNGAGGERSDCGEESGIFSFVSNLTIAAIPGGVSGDVDS